MNLREGENELEDDINYYERKFIRENHKVFKENKKLFHIIFIRDFINLIFV